MAQADSGMAKFIRGLVKFVFIGCYAAFMWASIHHVATYFNNFEQNGSGNVFGSYLLAGAFDVTALVTTIGVMFFRKSMPGYIQWVVWAFIIAIAIYSFFINWEYAARYQSADLVLQPIGETTPVFDAQGNLHYVMVMKANTSLLFVNPLLASGFTIFSLIYSVVAEFFGTKPPTADELLKRKHYLEETAGVLQEIKQLEEKNKGKGLIAALKEKAIEGKTAWKEVTKSEEEAEETDGEEDRNAEETEAASSEEIGGKPEGQFEPNEEAKVVMNLYPNTCSWLSGGPSTVSLRVVVETMNLSMKLLNNRVAKKQIRATKNKSIVYKSSLVRWAIAEIIPEESKKVIHLNVVRNDGAAGEQSSGDKLAMTLEALKDNPEITDEMLAETLGLTRPASARFWRLKAQEIRSREAVLV